MRLTKKKLFVTAVAVSLIAILSMGTLAWFNASDEVTNTFKVATNDSIVDPTFDVEVSETGLDGQKTTDGNTYYDVVPGDVIDKDPTVKNTGDYTQWIRVAVTMTNADKWDAAGGSLKFTDIFEGSAYDYVSNVGTVSPDEAKWLLASNLVAPNANGEAVWYLYLNRELAAGSDEVVFTKVNIEEDFTLEEVKELDGYTITVKAEAVQRDNTGDNAVAAFKTVGWAEGAVFVDQD